MRDIREEGMSKTKTGATYYYAQLGLSDKGRAFCSCGLLLEKKNIYHQLEFHFSNKCSYHKTFNKKNHQHLQVLIPLN